MSSEKKESRLHPRNKNRERYDLNALMTTNPRLTKYIKPNNHGDNSIDFANPVAVKMLNKAILKHYYRITFWSFPDTNLCPPIPGRADYIHHVADLLSGNDFNAIPKGDKITCFDIGVGASCIYPIIGVTEYGWSFIASDIDSKSIKSAKHIAHSNASLNGKVNCVLQPNPKNIFYGVIEPETKIDISICNPPFHSSAKNAQKGTQRKVENLTGKKVESPTLNFAGVSNELICDGGEYKFITNMIKESVKFSKNVYYFSTLVSKEANLKGIYKTLEKFEAKQVKTINMGTGNKISRIVAWTFLSEKEQKTWRDSRWRR